MLIFMTENWCHIGTESQTNIFLEFIKFGAEQGEVAVDLFAICHHSVDLICEAHVLSFLGNQVIFAA